MFPGAMDRFDPLSDAFCDSTKGQALLDEIAAARPWRRSWRLPIWLYLIYLRRCNLAVYAGLYALVVIRDPWVFLAVLCAALWFEWRVSPKAMDLRLDDRDFVRFVLSGNRFQPAGGSAETRRVFWRALWVLVAGVVLALPLWYLARLDSLNLCGGTPADGPLCSLARFGTEAFAIWFGMLMLAPVAYTSRYYPLLLPVRCPADRQDGPILRQWHAMNLSVWFPGWPLPIIVYVVIAGIFVGYCLYLVMLSSWTKSLGDPETLIIAFCLGSYFPACGIVFAAEFKGSMIVRHFLKSEYAVKRTQQMRG